MALSLEEDKIIQILKLYNVFFLRDKNKFSLRTVEQNCNKLFDLLDVDKKSHMEKLQTEIQLAQKTSSNAKERQLKKKAIFVPYMFRVFNAPIQFRLKQFKKKSISKLLLEQNGYADVLYNNVFSKIIDELQKDKSLQRFYNNIYVVEWLKKLRFFETTEKDIDDMLLDKYMSTNQESNDYKFSDLSKVEYPSAEDLMSEMEEKDWVLEGLNNPGDSENGSDVMVPEEYPSAEDVLSEIEKKDWELEGLDTADDGLFDFMQNIDLGEHQIEQDIEQIALLQTTLNNLTKRKGVGLGIGDYITTLANVLYSLQDIMKRLTLTIVFKNNFEHVSTLISLLTNVMEHRKLKPPKRKYRQGALPILRKRLDKIYNSMSMQLNLINEYLSKMLRVPEFTEAYDSRLQNIETELLLFVEKEDDYDDFMEMLSSSSSAPPSKRRRQQVQEQLYTCQQVQEAQEQLYACQQVQEAQEQLYACQQVQEAQEQLYTLRF